MNHEYLGLNLPAICNLTEALLQTYKGASSFVVRVQQEGSQRFPWKRERWVTTPCQNICLVFSV